jgi:hypothetical protein
MSCALVVHVAKVQLILHVGRLPRRGIRHGWSHGKVTQSHQSANPTRPATLGHLTGIDQPTAPLAGPSRSNISYQHSTLINITAFFTSQYVTFLGGIFGLETSDVWGELRDRPDCVIFVASVRVGRQVLSFRDRAEQDRTQGSRKRARTRHPYPYPRSVDGAECLRLSVSTAKPRAIFYN